MKKLVTVLLPTYNGKRFIRKMLNSIFFQDYRPLEVIISDDASTDGTAAVIRRWLEAKTENDISFQLIENKKNRGLSGNISNAVKYIHGKYLLLADQDDIWKRNKVSRQVAYLEENADCEMCVCDRGIINGNGEVKCKSLMRYEHRNPKKRSYKDVLNQAICYSANCICLRTEHLNNIFPIPDEICEHDTFIAVMAAHFGKIGYVREPLTMYRIHGKNLSGNYAMETTKNLLRLEYIIIQSFKRINRRETIDPVIIKETLMNRFNENNVKFSTKLYPGQIKNIYITSLCYICNNFDKWRRFV